jgi:hypothetical protein
VVLIVGILHHSALLCQQIEGSCSFISYNFSDSLKPDDAVEDIFRGAIAPGASFVQVAGP